MDLIEVGNDHHFGFVYKDGQPVEFAEYHFDANGDQCGGISPIGGDEGWQLRSVNPPTVFPSINCLFCDSHGFVIKGKWFDDDDPALKEEITALQVR